MLAIDLVLVALAQASATGAPPVAQVPDTPPVEVIAPTQPDQRRVCRQIRPSNSRIPVAHRCHTRAEWEEQRQREQSDAERGVDATNQRTDQAVHNSGYGNWAREHQPRPIQAPR